MRGSGIRSHVILVTEPASQFVRARESVALLSAPPRYLQALICTSSDECSISQVWRSFFVRRRGVDPSAFSQDISVVTELFEGENLCSSAVGGTVDYWKSSSFDCWQTNTGTFHWGINHERKICLWQFCVCVFGFLLWGFMSSTVLFARVVNPFLYVNAYWVSNHFIPILDFFLGAVKVICKSEGRKGSFVVVFNIFLEKLGNLCQQICLQDFIKS